MSGPQVRRRFDAKGNLVTGDPKGASSRTSAGLTSVQKAVLGGAAVLILPSMLMQLYEKTQTEQVDLSSFNLVTHYDKPASEMFDNTLRIQYCASWQVNGQFKRCAMELQQQFPNLRIEGGPYTPPAYVQHGIKAVRAAQVAVVAFFFLGEQMILGLGKTPPEYMGDMQQNVMVSGGIFYGLNCIASMLKSINAFEIWYNGKQVFSKIKTGEFPQPGMLAKTFRQLQQA